MDKIDLNSRDILGGNVEKIAELFPGVVTETKDEATGELKKVVDFDLLRQHLSDELVEGDRERFRLDWPGKKASILKANTPADKTLRPVREDSEDFYTTENVFIEGDNFEVLKVLQESYLGKIKMIYIDPPYNTGKDFIYRDNFTQDREDYEEEIGVRDDESGGKLVKNTETNGRYHSDWLSMMQERLIVARDLLTDDGVIFISIDDNEQANLKKLCDEVFNDDNFIGMLSVENNPKGRKNSKFISVSSEYCMMYARNISSATFHSVIPKDASDMAQDENGDYVRRSGKRVLVGENFLNNPVKNLKSDKHYSVYYNVSTKALKIVKESSVNEKDSSLLSTGFKRYITFRDDLFVENTYTHQKLKEMFGNGKLDIRDNKIYEKHFSEMIQLKSMLTNKKFEAIVDNRKTIYELDLKTTSAKQQLDTLLDGNIFDFPKNVSFIMALLGLNTDQDSTILDFFSGSGTTAHAVMQLNAEDGGNRKHIQVQLAEPTDDDSEAHKAGYKSIPEISRERIRRAGKKIREDYAEQIAKRETPLDTGFRAYKLSSSNFKDIALHPNETTQQILLDVSESIKEDRTADDLLTEVILSLGLTLDLPIEIRDIAGHNVYFVGGNSLVACFGDKVSLDIVDDIAAEKPLRVVFKDSSFESDEVRINVDIRLKQLSPDTAVQVV